MFSLDFIILLTKQGTGIFEPCNSHISIHTLPDRYSEKQQLNTIEMKKLKVVFEDVKTLKHNQAMQISMVLYLCSL